MKLLQALNNWSYHVESLSGENISIGKK